MIFVARRSTSGSILGPDISLSLFRPRAVDRKSQMMDIPLARGAVEQIPTIDGSMTLPLHAQREEFT